jgi:hypothetical protein
VRGLTVPPPRYRTASMCVRTVIERPVAADPTNDCSMSAAAVAEPVVETPIVRTASVPVPWASRWSAAYSVEGASRANRCQPSTTALAVASGQVMRKNPSGSAPIVASRNDVTMPRLPPRPPRRAQKRSAFSVGPAVRTVPSAVTTSIETTRSQVRPWVRVWTPIPPPRVSPATPTVGHVPVGSDLPCSSRNACTS